MTKSKLNFAIGMSLAMLAVVGMATISTAQSSGEDTLTTKEILKKSQDAYASLSSYSDEGKTVSSLGSTALPPYIFNIKLARPDFYRVEWKQDVGSFANKGVAWSAGDGDYMKMGDAVNRKVPDKDAALGGATGVSGGAAASIPGTFFKMNWGGQLADAMESGKRKADEKIGGTDCYVLTEGSGGRTRTLWIGKQDLLIRQIETVTSAEFVKAAMADAAKGHPELQAGGVLAGEVKAVETHTNIVINKPLSKADFDVQAGGSH